MPIPILAAVLSQSGQAGRGACRTDRVRNAPDSVPSFGGGQTCGRGTTPVSQNPTGPSPAQPRLLRVPEVASILQVSPRTVWRWIAEGQLPMLRLKRAVRIRQHDLDRLLQTGLPQPKRRRRPVSGTKKKKSTE
jgi:excisionase family DNA binding protein